MRYSNLEEVAGEVKDILSPLGCAAPVAAAIAYALEEMARAEIKVNAEGTKAQKQASMWTRFSKLFHDLAAQGGVEE